MHKWWEKGRNICVNVSKPVNEIKSKYSGPLYFSYLEAWFIRHGCYLYLGCYLSISNYVVSRQTAT